MLWSNSWLLLGVTKRDELYVSVMTNFIASKNGINEMFYSYYPCLNYILHEASLADITATYKLGLNHAYDSYVHMSAC